MYGPVRTRPYEYTRTVRTVRVRFKYPYGLEHKKNHTDSKVYKGPERYIPIFQQTLIKTHFCK